MTCTVGGVLLNSSLMNGFYEAQREFKPMPTGRKMKHVTIIGPNFHHQSFTDDKKTGLINAALPLVGSKKLLYTFTTLVFKGRRKDISSLPNKFNN